MDRNRWGRTLAVAGSLLGGLATFFLCLGIVSAQAPDARPSAPAAGQTWFVAHTPGEGLVGYWKFDQVFDHKVFNSASAAIQTILTGGSSITTGVPLPFTQFGTFPDFGALELDGVNGEAVVTDNAALDVATNSFSVAAWVRRVYTGTHTADLIYDSGTQTNHWYFGFLSNDKLTFTTNGAVDYSSSFTVSDSNWHHVAAVVSGSGTNNLTIYLDGVPAAPLSAAIAHAPSGPKLIGNKNGSFNTPFDGDIDELRLYNRPLSAAEVQRLAAGRGCVVDGTSWATAFGDLQCAIMAAGNGDQVWLAQGNFSPGTAREASFHILNDVSLLGGFAGGETSPAQRPAFQPNAPLTALTGDAAGDDLPDTFGNYDENACNVVTTGLNGIPGSTPSDSFDGLAIQDGNASSFCTFPLSASGGGLADFSARQLAFHNIVFQANLAHSQGGGMAALTNLSLNGVVFSRNKAAGGGALVVGSPQGPFGISRTVTIAGSSFFNNQASGNGGALQVLTGTIPIHLSIASSAFSSNQAHNGGAIFSNAGFNLAGSEFDNNTATEEGGALFMDLGNPIPAVLTLTTSSFHGNLASQGGGIWASAEAGQLDVTLSQDTFSSNQATVDQGGAIAIFSLPPGLVRTQIGHATFTGNVANDSAGAVSQVNGPLAISDSQFYNNSSQIGNGGALDASGPVTATVTNTSFMTNTAASQGGAVSIRGTLVMTGGTLAGNEVVNTSAPPDFAPVGGGVYVSGTAAITNSQFLTNTALAFGLLSNNLAEGGGLMAQGSLSLSGGMFQGNTAEHGGGLAVVGSATILSSQFQDNNAGSGGGVFADGDLSLISSRLIHNTAEESLTNGLSQGGGVRLQHGGLGDKISNNLFQDNLALPSSIGFPVHGGAVSLDGFLTSINDNTIVDSSLNGAPAVSVTGTTTDLVNDIITSHTVGIESLGGQTFVDRDLFSGDTLTATGVISDLGHSRVADPRFVDPAHGDDHLRLNSPAIDAGDNTFVLAPITTDLDGNPRFVDVPFVPDTGAGAPPIVDIGAFEASSLNVFLPLTLR
jgi:predicted outer membrane repeat protein